MRKYITNKQSPKHPHLIGFYVSKPALSIDRAVVYPMYSSLPHPPFNEVHLELFTSRLMWCVCQNGEQGKSLSVSVSQTGAVHVTICDVTITLPNTRQFWSLHEMECSLRSTLVRYRKAVIARSVQVREQLIDMIKRTHHIPPQISCLSQFEQAIYCCGLLNHNPKRANRYINAYAFVRGKDDMFTDSQIEVWIRDSHYVWHGSRTMGFKLGQE